MHPVELKIVRPGAVCDAEFYRIFSLNCARLRLPKPDLPGALRINRFQRQPHKQKNLRRAGGFSNSYERLIFREVGFILRAWFVQAREAASLNIIAAVILFGGRELLIPGFFFVVNWLHIRDVDAL